VPIVCSTSIESESVFGSDKVTKELYGYTNFVLDARTLRSYYEHYEPIPEWRDWPAFLAEVENRVSSLH
jgi:hypothetical protein